MAIALHYLSALLIGITIGAIITLHRPTSDNHARYVLSKELQTSSQKFYFGDTEFSPTKYKGLWLAKVVARKEVNE